MPGFSLNRRRVLAWFGVAPIAAATPEAPAVATAARAPVRVLFTRVNGEAYYQAREALSSLTVDQPVTLRREPDNIYDRRAIEVLDAVGRKLGYVARIDNSAVARMMDAGERFEACVARLDRHRTEIQLAVDWLPGRHATGAAGPALASRAPPSHARPMLGRDLIRRLRDHADTLADPVRAAALTWVGGGQQTGTTADGGRILQMPYAIYSDAAKRLLDDLRVATPQGPFDTTGWMQGPGTGMLKPARIAGATPAELGKLRVYLDQADRFCEGTIAEALEDGTYLAMVRRLLVLAERPDG